MVEIKPKDKEKMTDHIIHNGKKKVVCDACGYGLMKGDYYQVADAGEIYCHDCVVED